MKRLFALLFILLVPFASFSEEVEEGAAPKVNPYEYEKELTRVEEYLNGITNLVADFTQISPEGDVSTGKFYLARPGKLRWQYDPPTPILIIANGSLLSYYDYELDQISHVKVNATLAGVLTRPEIKFTSDIEIFDVKNEAGVLSVTLQMKNKPEEGKLTLVFSEKPITLRKMDVVDANGKVTQVAFDNLVYVTELEKSLFVLDSRMKKN